MSLVGTEIDRVSFPVEEGKIREFACAIGLEDPVFHDVEAAAAAGHRSLPAPPTFAVVAGHWRDQAAMVRVLELDLKRVVVGGTTWEYGVQAYAGDRLTGTRVVTADETKANGMRILTLTTALTREDGELVVRQLDTIIERAPK